MLLFFDILSLLDRSNRLETWEESKGSDSDVAVIWFAPLTSRPQGHNLLETLESLCF